MHRDPDKLERILKLKRRQKEETMERKDTKICSRDRNVEGGVIFGLQEYKRQ
jgi:hypothetical protein